ncbi:MAG: exonuclease domain-containing protein [Coriobacteriia bacterium]|nr:exonuclease domain-containing protein [Coriobacteriia bacterium]
MLDLLVIPGTKPNIKANYASLAKRAEDYIFAALEPEFVILDTETTGFDPQQEALIEVAAAIVCGSEIKDSFSTFVNPNRPIPPRITEITNISDADVAEAPSAEEVMRGLKDFCGNRLIVAHNAPFDQAFIQANSASDKEAPCPLLSEEPWIDTVELARIAMPLLREYNLETLSAAFAPESRSTHRAIDDVLALAKVWRVILVALSDLPLGLCSYLADRFSNQEWASLPVLRLFAAHQKTVGESFDCLAVREQLTRHLREQQKTDAIELEGGILTLEPVEASELAEEYSATGLLGAMYPEYETRYEQLSMAEAVAKAFNTSGNVAIEAGTGVGKSMAYLLPAALFAKRNGVTCGVATKSNALLDQLIYHELPRLNAALEAEGKGGLEYLSLKGYEHYPCLRKLLKTAITNKSYKGEPALVAHLLSYISQSVSGDIDAINVRRSDVPRFEYLASADDCLGRRCRYYRCCLLHSMRRQAKNADIIVTNHSLLFCDVMSEGSLLPPVRHWIIDEAHGAEGEARRQLSSELDAKALTEAIRATLRGGGLLDSIRTKAASLDDGNLVLALATKASATAEPAKALSSAFFQAVANLVNLGEASDYNQLELWLNERLRESAEWALVTSTGSALSERIEGLVKELRDLISSMSDLPEMAESQSMLAGHTMTISAALDTLRLILDGTSAAFVYSAQLDRRVALNANKLVASYYDVGEVLAQGFYPNQLSVVYTSATIALGSTSGRGEFGEEPPDADFSYFNHSVGLDLLDPGCLSTLQLDSSYDFETNMAVFVPLDMAAPNEYHKRAEYLSQLDELLFSVHKAMGGSVLTLFTNRREMEEAYERLRPAFEANGLEVSCQYAGTSRTRLREKFIENKERSLFALRSFWEGFDAPGDTLRCVIIPKLPFGRPNDPLQLERDKRERGAWSRYVLPEAVISLKQAAGRLIRSSSDSGYLVLADTRLTTKFYGKAFLAALPSQNIHYLSREAIAERMKQ